MTDDFLQEVDEARDVSQRRPQVVRDRVTERLELLVGNFQLPRMLAEFLVQPLDAPLRLAARRDVARHLDEAQQPARLIAHGIDLHVREKNGPVGAHPLALVLEMAVGFRLGQGVFREAFPDPCRGIKAAEVLPDDLLRPVALHPFRPGIPADDPPARVEHDHGVVLDAADHGTEPLLAFAQDLLRAAPGAVGPGGQEKADGDNQQRTAGPGLDQHLGALRHRPVQLEPPRQQSPLIDLNGLHAAFDQAQQTPVLLEVGHDRPGIERGDLLVQRIQVGGDRFLQQGKVEPPARVIPGRAG